MATKSISWNTGSGNITLTYQGQGDGTISVQSDANDLGSARSQVITVKTVDGTITRNLTISQVACPFPVGDVRNFSYTGSYQDIELPAGKYKLQCWGAQGGSNDAKSSYGITAQAGGKGGYSEGIITLSTKTTVRVYVGGAGSSSAGGFNGGGITTGSSSYNSDNEQGVSRMGGGGGATDIRLSDGALLSRMIVAGGGAGGAMCYKKVTTNWETVGTYRNTATSSYVGTDGKTYYTKYNQNSISYDSSATYRYKMTLSQNVYRNLQIRLWSNSSILSRLYPTNDTWATFTFPSGTTQIQGYVDLENTAPPDYTLIIQKQVTTISNDSQVGGVGGGTQGGAYSSSYAGKQNAAGVDGSFGQGAHQYSKNNRYASGAGGGGWYGGGRGWSNSDISACKNSGGGSGFVNIAASAGNRPSGYTGPQLDSGSTVDGEQTFEAPAGGTETGHTGNGYARITRLV